jgi:hypothetical protein
LLQVNTLIYIIFFINKSPIIAGILANPLPGSNIALHWLNIVCEK